jgi:acyl-CoA synthetase (AMP-forming)/AMP-acid ligase II
LWAIGAAPVPVAPPFQLRDRSAFLKNLSETAARLNARFLCVSADLPEPVARPLRVLTTAAFDDEAVTATESGMPDPDNLAGTAFLQLTSGSTQRSRGVVIRHDRLMLHMAAMSAALPTHSESVAVSWLPLHHDMGLVRF